MEEINKEQDDKRWSYLLKNGMVECVGLLRTTYLCRITM